MAKRKRPDLKSKFQTGDRPTQEDFENLLDSYLNIEEDGVDIVDIDDNQYLLIKGSIKLNTEDPTSLAGSIRWNGTQFQGHDGTDWQELGGGGDSVWSEDSGNITFTDGNVGIGIEGALQDRFEVELGNNAKARIGNMAVGNGTGLSYRNYASFSHTALRIQQNYALMQAPDGRVRLNCALGQSILFTIDDAPQAALIRNNFVVGNNEEVTTNSAFRLQVNGSAFKNDGNAEWNNTSDVAAKENIHPFADGLKLLKKLNPVSFNYNGKLGTIQGLEGVGVIAQEVQKLFPYMVDPASSGTAEAGKDTEFLTTNMSALKYVLVNAVKEIAERLEKIEELLENQKQEP